MPDTLPPVLTGQGSLACSNAQLQAALGNLALGLTMYDAEERLVVVNQRWYELSNTGPDAVRPGMTYKEVAYALCAAGNFGGRDPATVCAERRARIPSGREARYVDHLRSGMVLASRHVPLPEGGWVSTFEDVTEIHRAEQRIAHLAHHDSLTGLANRELFRTRLGEARARATRGEGFAVLLLDLDRFKAVNDTLGHQYGDELLLEVTRRLRAELRETDTIARLGGDEFAILQAAVDQPRAATSVARRLIDSISAPYEILGHRIIIGASVGISIAPPDGWDADTLIKKADLALYRAKADGRGNWRFFEPGMDARMQERRLLELDLRRALAEHEFVLHYQPLVDLHSRRPTGFEALIRWHHPQRGLVPPGAFIPLAEEMGLITPMGEWVLRQACAEAARWPGPLKVAVNLSPIQFRQGARLVETVESALKDAGLPPPRLELEVTESVLLADVDEVAETIARLRDMGVSVSLDDFGTGYSSLSLLRRLPFDRVKIDRSFVAGLGTGEDSGAIVRAVLDLCGSLGLATTAEGVETADQLNRLAAEGCEEVQGYLLGRPMPACDVPAMLERLSGEAKAAAA
jgi:diguanylate cyclase (GGDEF)-like protein